MVNFFRKIVLQALINVRLFGINEYARVGSTRVGTQIVVITDLKKIIKNKQLAVMSLLFCMLASSNAQELGVETGIGTIFPTVGLSIGYNDNVALSDNNEISSTFYQISPGLRLQTGSDRNRLQVDLTAEIGEFTETSFDDYTDYGITADWQFKANVRNKFGVNAGYRRGHDERGQGIREFIAGTPDLDVDEYDQTNLDFRYQYGANGARGRIELRAGLGDFEYVNNRAFTGVADYESEYLGGAFYWRGAPKTELLFDIETTNLEFDQGVRDSDELVFGVGVQWQATAKTEGRISVGYRERDLDDSNVADYDAVNWEAAIRWLPRTYSIFELKTNRDTANAFGESLFLVRDSVELAWRHNWRSSLSTVVDIGFATEDLNPGGRDDDTNQFGVTLDYRYRPGILFGIGLRHTERDSNLQIFDYSQNTVLFSAELSF